MDPSTFIDPQLTLPDRLVVQNLLKVVESKSPTQPGSSKDGYDTQRTIQKLAALNDVSNPEFDPTVFQFWDTGFLQSKLPEVIRKYLFQPYIRWAQGIVRVKTDVVIVTHLFLYLTTSIPSALLLYYHFTWIHGIAHCMLHLWYTGTYTLMKHQHIHMNGILSSRYYLLDLLFPFILDPLLGHTWNSYYYHHIKHHHVEGNGPDDLNSTLRYDRDNIYDFMCYVGRFFFLVWLELPLYFVRKGKFKFAFQSAFWEASDYAYLYLLYRYVSPRATFFVFLVPLLTLRIGLMVGNWGQHAFVDSADPDSDFRSSITLIDVASNRFCFNDGYHTSHHLNPRRHWREHPVAFMKQKERYAEERALVFRNIDFIMITVKLLQKDYMYLAKCLVPMGDQVKMSLQERADMLRSRARRFTSDELQSKFRKHKLR
ncbi:hypothetical protein PRK78_002148 [Emydomyces testavorans]|uniref:Fatty acid desaturase domain-containing protein n=1 Tax=Emydomyces testavorans TaxID=2070801 RepID=A0AAF0DDX1_9EURO|nr:hypothetical protein PRK78_002148 [Emydomyces testavorans]